MGKYVAENTVKQLIKADKQIKGAKVLIMGFTFKEDVPDARNTKVADIINELREYGIKVYVTDPVADREEVMREYALNIQNYDEVSGVDAVILAVAHKQYREIPLERLQEKYSKGAKVLMDVKSIFMPREAEQQGFLYWSL